MSYVRQIISSLRAFHLPIPRLIYGNTNTIVRPHLGYSIILYNYKTLSVKFSTNFLFLAYLLILAKKNSQMQ